MCILYIYMYMSVCVTSPAALCHERGPLLSPGPQMAWCPKISRALEDGPTWPTMEQCPDAKRRHGSGRHGYDVMRCWNG